MKKRLLILVFAVAVGVWAHGASAPPDPNYECDATPCNQCGWNPLCYFYCCS